MSRIFVLELPFGYEMYFTFWEMALCMFFLLLVVVLVLKSAFSRVKSGREALVGQRVEILDNFLLKDGKYEGQVSCMGEIWTARSKTPRVFGEFAKVTGSEGLTLFI